MEEEEYRYWFNRIKTSFLRMGGQYQDAEDCAQDILLRRSAGMGQKQNVDQSVIDYLRRSGHYKKSRRLGTTQFKEEARIVSEGEEEQFKLGSSVDPIMVLLLGYLHHLIAGCPMKF